MVEQNGGKFRSLEKIIKNIAFDGNQKFFREMSLLYVQMRMRKQKKIVMATLNLKKEQEK